MRWPHGLGRFSHVKPFCFKAVFMRILGIDPGLQKTGWGVIDVQGSSLTYIGSGLIKTQAQLPLAARLATLDKGLSKVLEGFNPDCAVVEETFMNNNPASALKLGQARGVCVVTPARHDLDVFEYTANQIKKAIVGKGHAAKAQIGMMIGVLLPKAGKVSEDEADALAAAVCHAHHKPLDLKVIQ
jgi:crossover junction endodeoxyribonuclease RuvC